MSLSRSPNNLSDFKINFGNVPIGKTSTKGFKFKNSSYSESFIITKIDDSSPNYQVFDFDHYEFQTDKNQERYLKITYQPTCPNQKDIDFFKITGEFNDLYKVELHGFSLGPEVQCTVGKTVEFLKFLNCSQIRRSFKLKNTSAKIPLMYRFDLDPDGIFSIDNTSGIIQPKQHKLITIRFTSNHTGCFTRRLTCFILHHQPICFNLVGFYFKRIYYKDDFLYEYHPLSYPSNYICLEYFIDYYQLHEILPPVTVSEIFLDFGSCFEEGDCQLLTTNIKNNLPVPIEIQWQQSENFAINPKSSQILPDESIEFECKFEPDEVFKLFTQKINGQIMWEATNPICVAVPMPISLTLMGHSFPADHKWFPKVEVRPQIIILPLTYPTYPSWATFIIKSEEVALFKLIPPEKSNFLMKPMLGQIRSYQIIVVQLHTNIEYKSMFAETWYLEINGELMPSITIDVKAQTDVPEICFGTDNCVEFETTQPNCENSCIVPLLNNSIIPLRFKFYDITGKISINPSEGSLSKNEQISVACSYYAELEDLNMYEIKYELQAVLNDGLLVGKQEDKVKFITDCQYSELQAIPKRLNVGKIAFASNVEINFTLNNPGNAIVHFCLYIMNASDIPHVISPKKDSCKKNEKTSVTITLQANNLGKQLLKIGYKNRVNQDSDEIVQNLKPIELFTVQYISILPIIRFEEIVEHNFGHLFSKLFLWDVFQINAINASIKTMKNNQRFAIEINTPNFELKKKEFYIVFLIKNISSIPISIDLKRKKLCDCNYVEIAKGISFKQRVLLCPHRETLQMDLTPKIIEANSTALLTMVINYCVPNPTKMSYTIDLYYNRIIEMYINIKPMLPNYRFLTLYSINRNKVNFGEVYIGLKQPPIQIIWIYNNTDYQLTYDLDELPIIKLNNTEDFQIFECLNSTGCINSYSLHPLLFRFCPIETKIYKITTILEYNNDCLEITIEGSGTSKNKIHKPKTVKTKKYQSLPINLPVVLSIEDIKLQPMLTWNSVERVISIQNITEDSDIGYHWKPFLIDGIIRVDFLKERGMLKPQETHNITVRINSLNEPSNTTVILNCELLNITEYDKYKEMVEEINMKKMLRKDEFIITEKGTFYPCEEDFEITPPPEPMFVNVTVTVKIIGVLDKDTCLSIDYQMQQDLINPAELTQCVQTKFANQTKQIDKNLLKSVINNLASGILFSDNFRKLLHQIKYQTVPLYKQIEYFVGGAESEEEEQEEDEDVEFNN